MANSENKSIAQILDERRANREMRKQQEIEAKNLAQDTQGAQVDAILAPKMEMLSRIRSERMQEFISRWKLEKPIQYILEYLGEAQVELIKVDRELPKELWTSFRESQNPDHVDSRIQELKSLNTDFKPGFGIMIWSGGNPGMGRGSGKLIKFAELEKNNLAVIPGDRRSSIRTATNQVEIIEACLDIFERQSENWDNYPDDGPIY